MERAEGVVLRDAVTLERLSAMDAPIFRKVRFGAKGELLAMTTAQGRVDLWDLRRGTVVQSFAGRALFLGLEFSADSRRLFTTSSERVTGFGYPSLDVWDGATGRLIADFPAAGGQLSTVQMKPGGLAIAAGHTSGYIELLNAFPWREEDFKGNGTLQQRVQEFAAAYWSAREDLPAASAGLHPPESWRQASDEMLDLTEFYNGLLGVPWQPFGLRDNCDTPFENLPIGVNKVGSVSFDIRETVQLAARAPFWRELFPSETTKIPVKRFCPSIHFLHGAMGTLSAESCIGAYRVRYAGGTEREIPIVLGHNVRTSWIPGNEQQGEVPGAVLAYRDCPSAVPEFAPAPPGAWGFVYALEWMNPEPGLKIESMQLEGAGQPTAPFLLAITLGSAGSHF